jgi:hypothetical protein
MAYGFFWMFAYIHYEVSAGNVLASTMINVLVIILVLIQERIEKYLYAKMKAKERKRTIFTRLFDFWMYGASVKTSLYLYYIIFNDGETV